MLQIVYVLVFCFVVHYLVRRLDASREEEVAEVEVAVVAKRRAAVLKADSRRTAANADACAANSGACARRSSSSSSSSGAASTGALRHVAGGPIGVRGAGPQALTAEAPYVYMTTVDAKSGGLWLSVPDGQVYDYTHPVFRRRPATGAAGDAPFKWQLVSLRSVIGSDSYAIKNLHSQRHLQYCGRERFCLQASNLQGLDKDMVFRLHSLDDPTSKPDTSGKPKTYALQVQGSVPLFLKNKGTDVQGWPPMDNWSPFTDNSALWSFEEKPST